MPFQGSFEVQAGKEWGFYESPIRYILDTFNRPSGVLGISTNGQMWNTLAGTWYVNSTNQAENDNVVTSGVGPYPLTSYDLVDVNQLGYANVSPGMGIAFNIQNSGNWYAIVSYDYDVSYQYGCTVGPNCTACGSTSGSTTPPNCGCGCPGFYNYNCGVCGSSYVYTSYPCSNPAQPGQSCSLVTSTPTCVWSCCNECCIECESPCTTCTSCSYNCSTGYYYYNNLVVLQCVNGTINTINTILYNNGGNTNTDPASISVQVKNGNVSYYAYSTNISGIVSTPYGLGTVLASGTLTISGTFGTQIGMVKSPSYYIHGATISGFFGTGL